MNWPVIKKIIWQPSGGYWLFYCSAIYLAVGMYSVFVEKFAPIELIQGVWLFIIALPLWFNPLARQLNMKETHMFNWFMKKKKDEKLVKFPEPKMADPVPPKEEKEKPVTTYYRMGLTDNHRVSFSMGYSEITMNADGLTTIIKQLEVYRDILNGLVDEE